MSFGYPLKSSENYAHTPFLPNLFPGYIWRDRAVHLSTRRKIRALRNENQSLDLEQQATRENRVPASRGAPGKTWTTDRIQQFFLADVQHFQVLGGIGGCDSLPLSMALHGSCAFCDTMQEAYCRDLPFGYRPAAQTCAIVCAAAKGVFAGCGPYRRDIPQLPGFQSDLAALQRKNRGHSNWLG